MSEIKELFGGRRTPVPRYVTEIFDSDECVIRNEAEFIRNFKQKFSEIILLERSAKEYNSWKYLIFRIFQLLEERIEDLKTIQTNGYKDTEELELKEQSITSLLDILNEILQWLPNLAEFEFPYFGQLLRLTSNIQVHRRLLILCMNVFLNDEFKPNILVQIANLFDFYTPFLKLFRYYDWDFKLMRETLIKIFNEKRAEVPVPKALEDLILAVLGNGTHILTLIKENEDLKTTNKSYFTNTLVKLLSQRPDFDKEDRQKFYKMLGEANLALFLLDEHFNERMFAIMPLIHCIEGFFINAPKKYEDNIPIQILDFSMEICHFQMKYMFKTSIIDLLLEKLREIETSKTLPEEEYSKKLDSTMIFFLGIKTNLELIISLVDLSGIVPGSDQEDFYKKLFCIDSSVPLPEAKPAILEIWEIIKKEYLEHFYHVNDENINLLSKSSASVKDQISLIACLVFRLTRCCISELNTPVEDETEDYEVFQEECRPAIYEIYEQSLKMFEDYSLEYNYLSVDLLGNIFSIFQESRTNSVQMDLEIPTRLIKKFERLVEWCYSEEFEEFLKKSQNQEFSYKIIKILCMWFGNVFVSFDEGLLLKARKDYVTHMCNFTHIDFIWEKYLYQVTPITETAKKAQEEIVRYYIALHLHSQILSFQGNDTDELIYYNIEKLKQVWKLILYYSNYQKYISEEFNTTFQIIETFQEREENVVTYSVLDCEVVTALFTKCIFNLDIEYDVTDFETVKESLYSLASSLEWEIFVNQLAINLQQKFEAILDEAEVLEFLYIQNDPIFVRSYFITEYRVSEFMKRIWSLVKLMRIYEFSALANDVGMKSVMSEYLARFFNSPIFHLIGYQNASDLASSEFFYSLSFVNSLFVQFIPNFVTKYPEVLSAINQDLESESEDSEFFRKKLLVFNRDDQNIKQFFIETYFDDPRKIHSISSKLFQMIFFNVIGLRAIKELPDSSLITLQLIDSLNERIIENTNALVHMKYLLYKNIIKKKIDPKLANIQVIDCSDMEAWISIPAGQSYYFEKGELLVSLLKVPDDGTKSKEDLLLYKLSVLQNLQDQTRSLGYHFINVTFFNNGDCLQRVAEATLEVLEDFYNLAVNSVQKDSECLSIVSGFVSNEESLNYIFGIITRLIERQFAHQFIQLMRTGSGLFAKKHPKDSKHNTSNTIYMEKLFKVLTSLLDKIDPKLLALKTINSQDAYSLNITLIIKSLYLCYESLLDKLAPESDKEDKDDSDGEEYKRKRPKKAKGGKKGRLRNFHHVNFKLRKHSEEEIEEFEDDETFKEEEEEKEEEKVEEKVETSTALERRKGFRKILSKVMLFFDMEFDPPNLGLRFREEFEDFLKNCRKALLENQSEDSELSFLSLKIYHDPLVNKFRMLLPVFLYLIGFKKNTPIVDQTEHGFYLQLLAAFTAEIGSLLSKLVPESFLKEEEAFVKCDFMPLFFNSLSAVLIMAKHLLKVCLVSNVYDTEFQHMFELILMILTKWRVFQDAFGEISIKKFPLQISKSKELQEVLYFGINKIPGALEKVANDKSVLEILIKCQETKFYVIGESYALRAFEPEKILEFKLKSLVYLDKSGSRIFQNNFIKTFEKYWDSTLKKIWNENFNIEKLENSENKHSDRIVIPKESPDMQGKINLTLEDKSITVSTLTFLKEGINPNTKLVIETIMDSIVTDTCEVLKYVLQNTQSKPYDQDIRKGPLNQLNHFAVLLGNYPELSPTILSYKIKHKMDISEEFRDLLPQWTPEGTFLHFILKYFSYLYHFSTSYFIIPFIDRVQTPLFIDYDGEPVLLSSYNELVIFQEIQKILEETLLVPEKFLKTLYTTAIWSILANISISILQLVNESKQKEFKLEIIKNFYSLCLKAVKVYDSHNKVNSQLKNETQVVYIFMGKLAEVEVDTKARNQLYKQDKTDEAFISRKKLPWVCSTLKEQYNTQEGFQFAPNYSLQSKLIDKTEEMQLVREKYSSKLPTIQWEIISRIFREANFQNVHPNLSDDFYLSQFPHSEHRELRKIVRKFFQAPSGQQNQEHNKEKLITDLMYSFLIDTTFNLGGTPLSEFGMKDLELKENMINIFLLKVKNAFSILPPVPSTFRVSVKKALAWHHEKIKSKDDGKAKELLEENKQEDFATLIQTMGLENLQRLMRKNKRRIKLLVQQQHEKLLMNKLEEMLKQEVTIKQMMSLPTEFENLDFYNSQSELDKKLILIFANKDFIESLTAEIQNQSKELKKALFNEQKKKKNEDSEESVVEEAKEEDGGDYEDEEEEERGGNGLGLGPRPELKEESDYNSEGNRDHFSEGEGEGEGKADQIEEKKFYATDNLESDFDEEYSDFSQEGIEKTSSNESINGKLPEIEPKTISIARRGSVEIKNDIKEEEKRSDNLIIILPEQNEIQEEKKVEERNENLPTNKEEEQKDEEVVSSSCHTEEISEENYVDEDDDEDHYHDEFDDDEPQDMDDESDGGDAAHYDYLYDPNDYQDEIPEINNFRSLMVEAQKIEKSLTQAKIIPKPSSDSLQNVIIDLSLDEWIEHVFYLFTFNQKKEILASDDDLTTMDVYSLFYKFLILTLLEPQRENTIFPLLALYLIDFQIKPAKNLPVKSLTKEKIIHFLHQYSFRSPSIFFKRFNIKQFSAYLDEDKLDDNKEFESFSIIELLFIFHLQTFENKDDDKGKNVLLQKMLTFLLQVRFTFKPEEVPAVIRELMEKNVEPLEMNILQKILSLCERNPPISQTTDIKILCKWLEYLSRIPQYRKSILLASDQLLTAEIHEEKEILKQLITAANESVKNISEEVPTAEKYYYNNFFSKINLQIAEIFNIFSYLINEASLEPELLDFIQKTENFNTNLKEISLSYLEALELLSKLVEKGYLESITKARGKLKKMMEVPVQYHLYLSKLKEIALGDTSEAGTEIVPSLFKISSDVETLQPTALLRSESTGKYISNNFQEILIQWMKKHRGFINNIFKTSQAKENLNLWIVKKFPWILDFNVKEKILRESFTARDIEEEENQEDDEETTLYIRRKHIIEDTLTEFERHSQDGIVYKFRIEFVNEPGVDQGGLKKEWLTLLSKEIFDPLVGLFKLSPNKRTIHPNPLSILQPGAMNVFKLAGALIGLTIKEKIPIDVNFSKSFLKLLTGVQPNLNDLEDIEPEFMQSLTWMLTNDPTDLEQPFIYELDLCGVKAPQELRANGVNTFVNEQNKELYIMRLCISKTLEEVEQQIEKFKQGFFEIVPEHLAKLFSSGELEILISGKSEIDIQDLMKYTTYQDLNKDSLIVQWFWEIIAIMDQNMLANLLFFITGSSKVPHGGFKDAPIVLTKGPADTTKLPIAHTCFSELEIPLYESKEQFYEKLFLAISEGKEGFYIA